MLTGNKLRQWSPNSYVNTQFDEAIRFLDQSTDPLKKGLVDAVEHLFGKIKPEEDLPPELAVRFRGLMNGVTVRPARHGKESTFAATIMTSRNKKRWHFATEILRLAYDLDLATVTYGIGV